MTLDSSNVQHEKLVIRLVEPKIPGFSVTPAEKTTPVDKSDISSTNGSQKSTKRPKGDVGAADEVRLKKMKK